MKVPIKLEITGPEFVEPPRIVLLERTGPLAEPQPHICQDGTLCYLDSKLAVIDPLDPLGMLGGCLKKAAELATELVNGKPHGDLMREFPAMWFPDHFALVDLPAGFSGSGEIRTYSHSNRPISAVATSAASLLALADACNHDGAAGSSGGRIQIFTIDRPLIAEGRLWPPETVQQLCSWLTRFAPAAVRAIEEDVVPSKAGDRHRAILLAAPNGVVGGMFEIPAILDRKEFRDRRKPIFREFKKPGAKWPLVRVGCLRADRKHLYSRSLGDTIPTLEDKKVLLVGCGTIGGFLAELLTKVGAGSGGRLMLVDPDIFMIENVGRHLLGLPAVLANKAEACRDHLKQQLGLIEVDATPYGVQRLRNTFGSYNLIIDATGEEPISLWLNQRRIEAMNAGKGFPPILHTWLHGAGSAAVGFLNVWPDGPCYKCLRPVHGGRWRYDPLKEGSDPQQVVLQACGDGTYVRYPVSASIQAAALALEMALDWNKGSPKPYLRSRQINREVARASFDRDPKRSDDCPACTVHCSSQPLPARA